MPTRNISLTTHFDRFVAGQVREGAYRNASEVLRAGLRLLEQQTRENAQKLKTLRALAEEGFREIDQGLGIEIHGREELKEFLADLGRQARKPAAARRRRRGA